MSLLLPRLFEAAIDTLQFPDLPAQRADINETSETQEGTMTEMSPPQKDSAAGFGEGGKNKSVKSVSSSCRVTTN